MSDAASETKALTEKRKRLALPTGVLGFDLTADGTALYAACMDGVYHLPLQEETPQATRLYQHDSYAASAVLLPELNQLVTAGYDGSLRWYDLQQQQVVRQIDAHQFWSWQMERSPDGQRLASVTGQYLAGGEKYEPAAEREPSVKVFDAASGQLLHALSHVPPVQAVCFSPDSRWVAAGNLMGEVRVWDLTDGSLAAQWTTSDFTSWGIIKSHCYIGGIFAMQFTPDGQHLLLAGMGPMRDPMAGNGRQLWQRFAWQEDPPRMVDQTHEGESGEGLMETLAVRGTGDCFLMGGRLRGGKWNAALFALDDGRLLHAIDSGFRMTQARFDVSGQQLWLAGTDHQPEPKDGSYADFGIVELHQVNLG